MSRSATALRHPPPLQVVRRSKPKLVNGKPKAKSRLRHQARIPGQRRMPAHTALAKALEQAIQDEMAAYSVSRSWVIASCCAYALGVELPDYKDK